MRRPWRFLQNVLQNRLGMVPKPAWCTYLVCNRCNARCSMCDAWKLERGRELSPDEVRAVFGKLGSLDVVRLTGGEPFLRKDFPELAEAVLSASDPIVLHVTTNGSFPDRVERFARNLSAPERLRVMVSLDGLPSTHNANRGEKVSFERALETVERLVRHRVRGVRVTVNHTIISPQSMAEASRLRARLQTLGVDVHTVLAYADSAMYGEGRRGTRAEDLISEEGYPLHEDLMSVDAAAFVRAERTRIPQLRDAPTRVGKAYYLDGLEARLRRRRAIHPGPRCTALRSHIRLLPNGDVPVCQFNTQIVGNLLDDELPVLWKEQARDARAWVEACSGCWAECEVVPNAIYGGHLLPYAAKETLRSLRLS